MNSQDGLLDLLKRIASLKRAPKTTKGRYPAARAPYKPVLLLTVLRRLQQGRKPYIGNRIEYEVCAQDFATLYAGLFGQDQNTEPKVVQAFWYLGTGSPHIWDLQPHVGKTDELKALVDCRAQIKSARKLTTAVRYATFPDSDWRLLTDHDVQNVVMSYLINEQFSHVRREIELL